MLALWVILLIGGFGGGLLAYVFAQIVLETHRSYPGMGDL